MSKLFRLIFLALVSVFLVGCGSSGGSSGGEGDGNPPDNTPAEVRQAYKQLGEYYAAIKSSVSQDFKHRVDYRVHYPVSQSSRYRFVQNLTAEKGFLSSSSDYYNATTVPLPTDILGAEANISKEGSDYRVRLSITSSKDEAANDTLFEQIFGTIEGNLSDSGFDVGFEGNVTSEIGSAINGSLGSKGFTGTKTDDGWRYVYHTTYNLTTNDYYIYYYYDIDIDITVIEFYFFIEIAPPTTVNDEGLPYLNVFDYAFFDEINDIPSYIDYKIQRYSKDENDAVDFMDSLAAKADCDYSNDHSISCSSDDTNITNISASRVSKRILYSYRAYATTPVIADIFLSSDAPLVSISTVYTYKGDLTSQFESYGKELVDRYGFTKLTTLWQKKEGGGKTYDWSYSISNINTSSATWHISDTAPAI